MVRRHETATVPENTVELYRDVYLPAGTYPVVAEYTIIQLHGFTEEHIARVWLHLSRDDLIRYGVNVSNCNVLGERTDLGAYVARGLVQVSR